MPSFKRSVFGKLDGREVVKTTLESEGMAVDVIDYGAIVQSVRLAREGGGFVDVVLGLDDLDSYRNCDTFFGAVVGRVANRIEDARFELDGTTYELTANNPPHHLHGGPKGYDKVVWSSSAAADTDSASVRLSYLSADGEEGYPGEVDASVTYRLTRGGALEVEMEARTTRRTPLALAQHSYWNLAGHDAGTLEDHTLELQADEITYGTPVVPNGTISPVEGTVFDLRAPTRLNRLAQVPGSPPGYDHNFVVRGEASAHRPVCELVDLASGRRLSLSANQPGVQIYTSNFLDGSLSGKGTRYAQHSAICLETQAFPNAINVPTWRGQVVLEPGVTYRHTMTHKFA